MKGTPTQSTCRGALSYRFFMRGEPPHKNAASWVPEDCGSNHIQVWQQDSIHNGLSVLSVTF